MPCRDLAAGRFRVEIDLEVVRSNTLTRHGDDPSLEYLTRWLQAVGFIPQQDGWWLGSEASLHCLHPSEVLQVQRM
jgi:hypothetical protein